MTYLRSNDRLFQRISNQQLAAALDDPRLPESFSIEQVHDYPALAIRTDETDGFWYVGYIDLFDGTYHLRERGERDGVNPANVDVVGVSDPEDCRYGRPRVVRKPDDRARNRSRLMDAGHSLFCGWHYGYPACCIAAFAWWILRGELPGFRYRMSTDQPLSYVPFVPCHRHHRRLSCGDMRGVEWLTKYRNGG
jgi:PAS domain-containing protein